MCVWVCGWVRVRVREGEPPTAHAWEIVSVPSTSVFREVRILSHRIYQLDGFRN